MTKQNQAFISIPILIGIIIIIIAGGIFAWQYFSVPKEEIKPLEEKEQQFIKILSPNGGERWMVGNAYNITWESSGLEDIDIGYRREGSGAEINGWIGKKVSASQGSYSWTIPPGVLPGLEYKQGSFQIRIGESPFQPGLGIEEISDISDNHFIIVREDETADWKTYRNEGYGFEIKYPRDWKATEKEYRWVTGVKPYLEFRPITQRLPEEILVTVYTIQMKDPSEPFIPPLDERGVPLDQRGVPQESVNIEGRKFYKDGGKFEGVHDITYIIFDDVKEKIGRLSFAVRFGRQRMDYYIPDSEFKTELEVFNQILSTFRFLE